MKKVGILGGTFDPVHCSHIELAKAALLELSLDRVLLIPAADPPHKSITAITPFRHRYAMLELAIEGVDGLEVSSIESQLPTPSYTIDTVRYLNRINSDQTRFYFIIGGDAFADLLTWKCHDELVQSVSLVVALRKGFSIEHRLNEIALRYNYLRKAGVWVSLCGCKDIFFLDSVPEQISSSDLRRSLGGESVSVHGVHPRVLNYIHKHQLYRNSSIRGADDSSNPG